MEGLLSRENQETTIILEPITTTDWWIRHSFFGMPGSANDINVLDRSPFIVSMLSGAIINCNSPSNPRERCFAKVLESVRKEIECPFGMLRKPFGILDRPSRLWNAKEMEDVNQLFPLSTIFIYGKIKVYIHLEGNTWGSERQMKG
ncbi:hypothetical protein PHMEG_0009117 [Phytophthora megakarya]|uniref:Uncharacterized protein n=1 Tax=Phytophthora megakarya TaxID=4795 RepID=A0A225WJG8_9STRA|nr:hypothetical protein PHMEG_0009117 [Phytophthora megakarya]